MPTATHARLSALCRLALPALSLLWLLSHTISTQAQGTNVTFGKNRVQYHDFTWSYYESDNFVTYFYLGGQDLGEFVVKVAEKELPTIENVLDYRTDNRIEILVYNDVTDLNQSNIGVGLDINNTGGVTKIIGNKIFVHFTGNHQDLRRQVREGIAQVLINNMIFGGSLQEVLQNAVLLNLPEWFVTGLIAYIGEPWSARHDSRLKDGILSGKYRKFNKLTGRDAVLAGHSFWYFVAEQNGREAIPNLLYLTRINRSLENGFLFVLGYTYKQAIDRWYNFFLQRYREEEASRKAWPATEQLDIKHWKNRIYQEPVISPDGQKVAFVTYDMGKWRLYIHNRTTGKTKKWLKGGFKTTMLGIDYGYPLFDFDPTGSRLLVFYDKRDNLRMVTIDLEKGEKQVRYLEKFQRIVDFSYTGSPTRIVLSAVNRGQSDLYTMDTRSTTVRPLTNDKFDDLQPQYADFGERQGILWRSNRTQPKLQQNNADSILPTGQYDIFFLNENGDGIDQVLNITQTPYLNESLPAQLDEEQFVFLSAENGIHNQFAGHIDTTFSHYEYTVFFRDSIRVYRNLDWPVWSAAQEGIIDSHYVDRMVKDTAYYYPMSNWNRGILYYDITTRARQQVLMAMSEDRYQIHVQALPDTVQRGIIPGLTNTAYRQQTIAQRKLKAIEQMNTPIGDTQKEEFFFQSEFDDGDTTAININAPEEDKVFQATSVRPYRIQYSTDYVLSQVDNTIIINPYQNFAGYGPVFQPPPLGGLITVSLSDLLEDYRFTGGFRIPTSFSGSEYFLKYEDLKHRLDKQFLFYRRTDRNFFNFQPASFTEVGGRQHTYYLEGQLKYPIDILRSVRGKLGYRNYKVNFQATDNFSLQLPPYVENWLTASVEYVYDDTYEVMLNILNGTRYKAYYELHKQFDLQVDPGFSFDPSLGTMHVVGFDFRHYQKIHRQITFAARAAGAASFGSKKLIYYLGGVDNWLMPQFNESTEVDRTNNYAFQTLATNLRGFRQNIRNGSNYMVINTELRVPVFSYLFNTPIRSELIRNFQMIGFADVGSAWEGATPFSEDNPFNTEVVERGPVRISAQYYRNPIVGGVGFGLRTVLFGYFVRLDRAWGIENGVIRDPRWYLSLNLDF